MTALSQARPAGPGWTPTGFPGAAAAAPAETFRAAARAPRVASGPAAQGPDRILLRRWKEEDGREHASAADPDFASLALALRSADGRLLVDGHCVHDGPLPLGFAAMAPAGSEMRAELRAPCDLLQLRVPRERLGGILAGTGAGASPSPPGRAWIRAGDPLIERLAWLLLKGGEGDGPTSHAYRDGVAIAIVSRLLDDADRAAAGACRGLVKWRLKRVQELIEAQLSERLSLADLARCAGLSRMHFAAQFRAATGLRPHEYLVRRRIHRAQEMLRTTGMPLVEVALSVGFQTQAHFTTVFRRLLGETPGRWRAAQRIGL